MAGETSPGERAGVVDLSSADWTGSARFLNIGVGGVLIFDTLYSQNVSWTVQAGIFPMNVSKIYKVGTTASAIGWAR